MSASTHDELPSPAAALLQIARLQTGISQAELARRAGVPASMVSAYERDKRQPTLPTLMRLLKAAGLELRLHLEPYNPADDPEMEERLPQTDEQRALWQQQIDMWRNATPLK
jgi:transcriptional regulator with XRE-family HTH domain